MSIESEAFVPRTERRLDLSGAQQDGEGEQSLRSPRPALSRWANSGILLAMLLIGILSYLTFRSSLQAEADSEWVVHTHTVQEALQSTIGNAIDTVSGGRGFALTRLNTFLDVEARAQQGLGRDLDTLRRLTADSASQQKRLDRLKAQVRTSLASTLKIEAARQQSGSMPPESELLESKRDIDAVRATIAEMQGEENRLLVLRIATAKQARRLIQIIGWSSTVVGMGLLALFGSLLRREIGSGNSRDARLRSLNADLEHQSALSRRNELRLLGAAESSMDCLYFCDAVRSSTGEIEDFAFTFVNSNAVRLVAFSREELIGGRLCELFPVNRKSGLLDRYRQVVLTGEPFAGDFAIQEETVKTAWLRIQAAKLGDGVAITASDITERKGHEEATRKINDRLSLATDSGGIGIWEWDIANDTLSWDQWMYRLYGMGPGEGEEPYLLWRQHLHPEDRDSVERQLRDGVDGVRQYTPEFRIVWDDGSVHFIGATAVVTRDEAGRPVRMVGTNTDITARKELEAERQATERSLRDQALIIDMADDTVFIRDGKDRITYWNQGAQRLYGWNREEALGHITHDLLKTQFPQPLAEIEAQFLFQGWWNGELVHTRRDGSLVTVTSSWTNRHDPITGGDSVLEINHDVTASKAAERALAKNRREIERASIRLHAVNKELEQFAYVASHDLKAPLRVIDNASQWLEEDLAEHLTAETRETMQLLRGRVQRMGKLLDDLLDYARVGREVDSHSSEAVAGNVLIDDALALLPTGDFTIAVSPRLSGMQLRRMPLQRILSNLIGNAIKHHDRRDGHIDVTVNETGEFYEFAVHDDGPGIPQQFHEQIFKMFQTLRPRDQVEGSGMGLTMARKTVESFGGNLWVESAEGQGATFRFTWPKDQRSARETNSDEVLHHK